MGIFSRKSKSTIDIPPICNVNLMRYLGTWYEIARFPHAFEKGLENVTATYNLKKNGKIEVINSGFKKGEKSIAKGVAWAPDKKCTVKLLVSFFRLIKSEYKIIKLDEENYSFAVITSSKKKYLWILSRKPKIRDDLYDDLISFVTSKGFDISKIIKVVQNNN